MAKWIANIYDTLKDAADAIELIDNTVDIHIATVKEGGMQKVLLAQKT